MNNKKITLATISYKNIIKKPTRSFFLIFIISILISTMFIGSIISFSLSKGVETLSDRLGADLIIVPQGYSTNLETILLRGEANSFFLPKDAMDKIKKIEGIEKVSPQTYLTTLKAACCSSPVQLMGIDFNQDFLIKSWLNSAIKGDLKEDTVIIGNKIQGKIGEYLTFFGEKLEIVGKLDPSGLGFDSTVFLNMNTIQKLAKLSKVARETDLVDDNELISVIMVKLTPGYVAKDVSKSINENYASSGIFSIVGRKFVNELSKNLYGISKYINILMCIIAFMSVILLGVIFSVIINERKREVNLFRVLGATKNQLIKLILLESFWISLFGTILGLILGNFGFLILMPLFIKSVDLPIIFPNNNIFYYFIFLYLSIGISIGPLVSLFSTLKITNNDIHSSIREDK